MFQFVLSNAKLADKFSLNKATVIPSRIVAIGDNFCKGCKKLKSLPQ